MSSPSIRRASLGLRFASALLLAAPLVTRPQLAGAVERKFLVTLAHAPKQFPGPDRNPLSMPTGGLVNFSHVNDQYFDRIPGNDISSFAEYWEEISYGDVTISGMTTNWLTLPWAIEPPLINPDDDNPTTGPPIDAPRYSPAEFFDGDGDGNYTYGAAERFNHRYAAVIVDLDGNPMGFDDGPFMPGPGSEHTSQGGLNAGHDVWKPGERFVDVDGDEKWDGFDETRNTMDWNGDGHPDNRGPWTDLNENGQAEAPEDCIYLPDSDNDGYPDCCPDGPGNLGCVPFDLEDPLHEACPATRWHSETGEIIDCNGNLLHDAEDIAAGISQDTAPAPDGVPDECQDSAGHWLPGRIPVPRCEFDDANQNGELDIVEPFENFLRRWDPCYFDPDVSPLNQATERAHWIKVFDPASDSVLSCDNPQRTFAYDQHMGHADPEMRIPSYIERNYPGDHEALEDQAKSRTIYGPHDPLGKLAEHDCLCAVATDGMPGGPCVAFDINGDGAIDPMLETTVCFAGVHAMYDPSDAWTDAPAAEHGRSTKLREAPGINGEAAFITATPEPGVVGSPLTAIGEVAWYQQAWRNRYGNDVLVQSFGVASSPPAWPAGFDPDGEPIPGGPETGRPIFNTPRLEPWGDFDPDSYDPAADRRMFKANYGGLNGDGSGWIGEGNAGVLFETGPLGEAGFESHMNAAILPEEIDGPDQPGVYFDGYVEYDDLPSSKYHRAGDQRMGEVTSPFGEAPWGEDRGSHALGGFLEPDMLIPAAGPLAVNIHGTNGRDAGNLMLLEYLTWRTDGTSPSYGLVWENRYGLNHPYAGPGSELNPNELLGFRDYNLDGMIDQGEVRIAGSENYLADAYEGTRDDGSGSEYPWNRERLIEDCVEILDELTDFDDFVDVVTLERLRCDGRIRGGIVPWEYIDLDETPINPFIPAQGVVSGIVLLPAGAVTTVDRAFIGASDLDQAIHNEDNLDPAAMFPSGPGEEVRLSWNLVFHDLVAVLDAPSPEPWSPIENFHTSYAAHSYLHSWEWFPDLYDYDVFGPPGPHINCPVGLWDIMARGGLVHPNPMFKSRTCTEWVDPVDIAAILTPGVQGEIALPSYEQVRQGNSVFLQNDARHRERLTFWSVGRGFDERLPGAGMLIIHHWPDYYPGYEYDAIIPADGSIEDNCGDAGDPWPGSTGATVFDCTTNPPAAWHHGECTGLEITNIVYDASGSTTLNLSWMPTALPSLRFIDPPGGTSVEVPSAIIYPVRATVADIYGGTWLRFFFTDHEGDATIEPDGGNYIGTIAKQSPGMLALSADWNIVDVADGQYALFAELIPGNSGDGVDPSHTEPRAGQNNIGDGMLSVGHVDVNTVRTTGSSGAYISPTLFVAYGAGGESVDFETLGVESGDQLMTEGFANRKPVLRTVTMLTRIWIDNQLLPALSLSAAVQPPDGPPTPQQPAIVTAWQITGPPGSARLETWVVTCLDQDGRDWSVTSSLTQPASEGDAFPHAVRGQPYTSIGGEVTFTIHSGEESFYIDDRFTFTTTGTTAVSLPIHVVEGEITEAPFAVIDVDRVSGTVPLTITFDGRASFDPQDLQLTYLWFFEDGSPPSEAPLVQHEFAEPGFYTVVLRVTNSLGLFTMSTVDIFARGQKPVPGDWDGDDDLDLEDYAVFVSCLATSGPEAPTPIGECQAVFDLDSDFDIDFADFGALAPLFMSP